jgi:glycosyltransferase involved in cell wall biosynthesis
MNNLASSRTRIAVIVPNVCDPDYRVVKQAETLARNGYEVRVFCGVLQPTGAPVSETLAGVQYERRAWQAGHTLKCMFWSFFPFTGRPKYAPRPLVVAEPERQCLSKAAAQPATRGGLNRIRLGYSLVQKVVRVHITTALFPLKKATVILHKPKFFSFQFGVRFHRWVIVFPFKKATAILRKFNSLSKRFGVRFHRQVIVLPSKRLAFQYLKPFSFRYVFEEEIADWQPDIIHVHDMAALYLGYKLSKRLQVPFIFDSHELETHRSPPLTRLMKFQVHMLERRCLPQAVAVTTVGQEISKYLSKAYNIPPPNVIYNAPAQNPTPMPGRWAPQPHTDFSGALRADLELSKDTVLLVYTGNAAINRGIEETIEALSYIKTHRGADFARFGPLHLALVGRCQAKVQQRLEQKVSDLNLNRQVHFCAPVPASGVSSYISSATVSVIPIIPAALSYEYAMPNKLFEAMIARLPILGSRLTEMSRTVSEYRLGESFTHGDPQDFADKLLLILSNREAYLGAPREAAIDKLCWEAQEEVLLSVFEHALAGVDTGRPA